MVVDVLNPIITYFSIAKLLRLCGLRCLGVSNGTDGRIVPYKKKLLILANPIGVLSVHPNDKEELFLFAILILDQVWKIRNLSMFENKAFSLNNTMELLKFRYEEAKSIAAKVSPLRPSPSEKVLWKKPPRHFIKINTDAAVKDGTSSAEAVARDHMGKVLRIRAIQIHTVIPEVAEAVGVLQGLVLAEEKGWSKVWCEFDARNVVLNLNYQDHQSVHWLAE